MENAKAKAVESNPSGSNPSASYSRGKEIVEAEKYLNSCTETEERCGICLLGSSGSICGKIDGCRHHFCFVCIMEWAKTESRCPLCKQRFRSIRRPAVPGLFPAERIVMIPERDQVYHPLGVESTEINETHLHSHCTLCHSASNEAYLVSCALCDSTFHTDCVGLGWDIPEAEFYCPDCHTCRIEYSKMQPNHDDSKYVDQETMEKIRMIRRGGNSISIHDLVADIRGQETVNRPLITQSTGGDNGSLTTRARMEQGIQALRNNWGRVQSGSLNISDVMTPYRREGTSQNNSVATISGARRENSNKESRDIDKSWEMMEKARLDLAKKAPQENRQQITRSSTTAGKSKATEHMHPPAKKPRPYGEGVSAYNSKHEMSYPNRGFAQFWKNDRTPGGSSYQPVKQAACMPSDPFNASTRDPQVGLGLLRKGATSTIEKKKFVRSEDVKAEIQSLVKHNLSAIHKDKKKLGSIGYKEVARVSTHTILAAYGHQHNEALTRSFSRPFCNHNKDMSNLVTVSCHDCFNTFVGQVVEAVLSEKM
ncbi:PHD and RING finger domain-containing protein 1 [Carex littledalei]|uniref:PHD and RING finger domain-containing protein 1 n=1 Tax=Carex littledalei TaxID=544730 RepID=A0A833QM19_9POAL|nr:PHD and RING finger domain-containing protein 1 [Carex littledalei]